MDKKIRNGALIFLLAGMLSLSIAGSRATADSIHDLYMGDAWKDPSSWNNNSVPGASDTAELRVLIHLGQYVSPSDHTIIPQDQSVGSLNMVSPHAIPYNYRAGVVMNGKTLTINNGGIWEEASFEGFYGAGSVDAYGTMTLIDHAGLGSDTRHRLNNGTVYNNYGTIEHQGTGHFQLGSGGGTLNNYGTYDLQTDAGIIASGYGETTNNYGLLKKTAGTYSEVTTIFNNQGTVEADSGTLYLNTAPHVTGNTLSGGKWVANSGATLKIATPDAYSNKIETNTAEVVLSGAGSRFGLTTGTGEVVTDIDHSLKNNQGSFTIKNGRNFTTPGDFVNSGTLTIGNGSTFTVADGYSFDLAATGIINGTGTFGGNLTNTGTVSPGNSPGILTVDGDYTQSPEGLLEIEIAGLTDYDVLDVSGSAFLGGSLAVDFLGGFVPETGDIFDILWADSIEGAFSVSAGFENLFSIAYDAFDNQSNRYCVRLEYIFDNGSNQSAVPEPATMILFGIGLIGIAGISRKKPDLQLPF